jgi:glutathione S-transferase
MKLFYAPGSSSLLPHIVLHEAELPFDPMKIDEHTKVISGGGDYRSVNPLGYVPALVLDDGTLLTEGAAIVQYIADLVPGKKLAPRTARSKGSNYKLGSISSRARCTRVASPRSSIRAFQRKAETYSALVSGPASRILTGICRPTST